MDAIIDKRREGLETEVETSTIVQRVWLNLKTTVIDVITAPEKINSTSEWRIFRTQKIAFSPSWRLNYGGTYVLQLV